MARSCFFIKHLYKINVLYYWILKEIIVKID